MSNPGYIRLHSSHSSRLIKAIKPYKLIVMSLSLYRSLQMFTNIAMLVLVAGLLASCSTSTPTLSEAEKEPVAEMSVFQTEVQAVEADSMLAESAMRRLALGQLRRGIDQKLESERKKLAEMYPDALDRDFILQLRIFTAGIGESDVEILSKGISTKNELWMASGQAQLNPFIFKERLKTQERLWRVFQHSEWVKTLQP